MVCPKGCAGFLCESCIDQMDEEECPTCKQGVEKSQPQDSSNKDLEVKMEFGELEVKSEDPVKCEEYQIPAKKARGRAVKDF